MKRIAFYGGSFDPVHNGHILIAQRTQELFSLDEFVFIPAFHAPHKRRNKPTSAYHRFAMLCLATADMQRVSVSTMELEMPERPYTVETLTWLNEELPEAEIFFVMGADSWQDITTWHEWKSVLKAANHIVVTRPGVKIGISHVPTEIQQRIVDLRRERENIGTGDSEHPHFASSAHADRHIYITDVVDVDISATNTRTKISDENENWRDDVPAEVAKYIEKYQIYS
jgi:nicotinate-nucleotide adenylyltransferase